MFKNINENISRRGLIGALMAGLFAHPRSLFSAVNTRPNILLIMADDLGYECLGCNGGLSYSTPRLDKLAGEGMRFTHMYSTPLCTPSRVQLLTGRYSFRNYLRFKFMKAKEVTFANMLQNAGYKTGIFGKWQLGHGQKGPYMAGFDEYCLFDIYSKQPARGSRYMNPRYYVNGVKASDTQGQFGPDVYSDHLCDFLVRHRHDPFLAFYSMTLPHTPFVRTPDSTDFNAPRFKRSRFGGVGNVQFFPDMVAYLDKMVGKVIDQLDRLGLAHNTLVIFTADNGCHPAVVSKTVNGKVRGGKGRTTDAGTHVPMIARWKSQIKAGSECDDLLDLSDYLPTFLDLTGAKPPWEVTLDGRSFLPQLRGQRGSPRKYTFLHYDPQWRHWKLTRYARNHRYKLYHKRGFFDLKNDPKERRALRDISSNPAAQKAKKELRAVLKKYKKGYAK